MSNSLHDRMARLGITQPAKHQVDPIAGAVSRQAQVDGARIAAASDRESSALAVAAWHQYNTANPFERARLRAELGSTLELGQTLAETANASRTLPAPPPPTPHAAASMLVDRGVFEQYAELARVNPIAAAEFRIEHGDQIERGSRVVVPEVAATPSPAPAPAAPPAPNPPPPQDPPPQAA